MIVPIGADAGGTAWATGLPAGTKFASTLGHLQLGFDGSAARAASAAFRKHVISLAGGLFGACVLLGWIVGRWLARPVRELADRTRALSAGNLDVELPAAAGGDLGALTQNLDSVLSRLREYRGQLDGHRRDLEEQVRERTLELEARMDEAEELARKAEEASRSKSQFLANMSHEIRTPMNGVIGMAELLLGTKLSDRQHRFTKTLHNSAQSLLAIINDILDYSRAEAGKLSMDPVRFSISSVAEEVVDLLSEQAQQKGLELTCYLASDLPPACIGEPGRLRQILTNLVGNAIKFTNRGQVLVRVTRCGPVETDAFGTAETRYFELSVSDTGQGIPDSERHRVFQSFTQVDGSMARRFGGTGLGLAIARQLVELMGGEIGFDSQVGEGSRFWFRVPLGIVEGEVAAPEPTAKVDELAGRRTLIVAPPGHGRDVLSHRLSQWQLKPSTADTIDAADAILRSTTGADRIDLVLATVPFNGWQGLSEIRGGSAGWPRVVWVLPVGQAEPESEERCVDIWLTRPTHGSDLRLAIERTLLGRGLESKSANDPGDVDSVGQDLGVEVLLVEDNAVNRSVASTMLEVIGCRVESVENGSEAVDITEKRDFDLVLMDCQMPVMDGLAATRAIRQREKASGQEPLRIIALTAHAMSSDREECLANGMDDYISKPFTKSDLARAVEEWALNRTHPPVPRAAPVAQPEPEPAKPAEQDSAKPAEQRSAKPAERDSAEPVDASQEPDEAGVEPAVLETVAVPEPGELEAAPAEAAPAASLDEQVLQQLAGLDPKRGAEILEGLARSFIESSTPLVASIKSGTAAGDLEAVRAASHTLKSSSAQIGGAALSQLAKSTEALAKEGRLDEVSAQCEPLQAEFDSLCEALAVRCFGVD